MSINSRITKNSLKKLEKITGGSLTFGKLILAIRLSEEISQIEFADKLAISKQQLCDLEHDRKSVSPKLAVKYAEKLGYSKEQFIRLCLQDMMDKAGIPMVVDVKPKRNSSRLNLAYST